MAITFSNLGNFGRLGNCYFQIAATVALALRNHDNYVFPICSYSPFINIPQDKFIPREKLKFTTTYNEPTFHYSKIPYRHNLNLSGYFQSEKYFKDCESKIREIFTPIWSINELSGVCAIHVRRGDYTQQHLLGCFHVLGMGYYSEAMNRIKARQYFVFSDDMEWCKQNFKPANKFSFIEGNTPEKDLSLMMSCEHQIAGNSSFSWWGSWLNKNPNKIVIVPRKWFDHKLVQNDIKDLIPDGWIKI